MFSKASGQVLVLASAALGALIPGLPTLSQNALTGYVHVNYTCTLTILGTQTFEISFEGWGPNTVAPSQPFKFTGGKGVLTAPAVLTYGANLLGADSADINITTFELASYGGGLSPASQNVLPNVIMIKNQTWTVGQKFSIPIPTTGVITTPAFTPTGGAGSNPSLQIGPATATIQLKNSTTGQNKQRLLSCNCSQPVPATVLGAINVAGATNTAVKTVPVGTSNYASSGIPVGFDRGGFRLTTACTTTALSGTQNLDFYIQGTIPTTAQAGGAWSFSAGSGAISFPAATVNALKQKYAGATTATGRITQLTIGLSGTSETTLNLAATPIVLAQKFPLTTNPTYGSALVVPVPQLASAPRLSGTFHPTGASQGSALSLTLGATAGSFTLYSSSGASLGTFTVSCAAPGKVLTKVPSV